MKIFHKVVRKKLIFFLKVILIVLKHILYLCYKSGNYINNLIGIHNYRNNYIYL